MNWIKDHDNQGKLTVAMALFLAMTVALLLPLFSSILSLNLKLRA